MDLIDKSPAFQSHETSLLITHYSKMIDLVWLMKMSFRSVIQQK